MTAVFKTVSVIDPEPNKNADAGNQKITMNIRNNRFVLSLPEGSRIVSALLFDLSGKKLETMSGTSGNTGEIVSSGKYAAGVYYYRVTTEQLQKTGVVTLQ